MPSNSFVDESIRGSKYLLAAVIVEHARHQDLRRELKSLRQFGRSSLHMHKEVVGRKRLIAISVAQMEISCVLAVQELSGQSLISARIKCLNELSGHELVRATNQLTLESSNSIELDKRILSNIAYEYSGKFPQYRHLPSAQEPLLWLPDIIAWCVGKGGEFEIQVKPLLVSSTD
jgi:hypothetical protein